MCLICAQGSYRPWKVLELNSWDFQAWKVLEKGIGPRKSWKVLYFWSSGSVEILICGSFYKWQLVQCNRVTASDVDDIVHQYQNYVDSMIHDHQELFTSFSPCVSRLDTLMVDTVSRNDSYYKLWKVVKMLLVLSHGQQDKLQWSEASV